MDEKMTPAVRSPLPKLTASRRGVATAGFGRSSDILSQAPKYRDRPKILFLSPVQPLLTPAYAQASAGKPGEPLPRWQMQASWVRALGRLGHEVRVVKYTPDDRIRLNWGERVWWNIRVIREIREIGDIGGFDLIIYSLGADVLVPWIAKIAKISENRETQLVVLSGVSPIRQGNPRERAMAPLVDLAATNDEGHAEEWLRLGAKRAVVLPIAGVDPELHYPRWADSRSHFFDTLGQEPSLTSSSPPGKSPNRVLSGSSSIVSKMASSDQPLRGIRGIRDIDVLFAGTMTAERRRFFDKLRQLLPKTVRMVIKEFVWEEEFAELMSRAKIGINLLRSEMKRGVNLRTFEIPAFGAMEITSFSRPEWLAPGKEVEVFGSVQEAAELVKKYLKDDKARQRMAAAGQERVMKEHTFDDRAKRLMEMIDMVSKMPSSVHHSIEIDVSVCIVNYKTDKELKKCMESVKKFTKGVSYEIITVDNSVDNRWYSGGNNLAASRTKGRYVLFLNPDCWLENDAITELVNFMDKHPRAGAAEPRQAYESGEAAPTGSLLPKWWIDAVEMTGLSRVFGSVGRGGIIRELGVFREFRQSDKDRKKNWLTEAVSGAAMMVRREVLDKIGGFDENLKLYYTDVDLCRRIKQAGWEIWHVGEISVRHTTRASTSKLPWDRLNLIYAADGREYYRKWGEGIGGKILYWGMKGNSIIINIINAIKIIKDHEFRTWLSRWRKFARSPSPARPDVRRDSGQAPRYARGGLRRQQSHSQICQLRQLFKCETREDKK